MYTTRPNEPKIDKRRHLDPESVEQFIENFINSTFTNTVQFLVSRNVDGSRNILTNVQLDEEMGIVSDRWYLDPKRSIGEQIAAMSHQVAETLANGQSLTLFGDGLFLDIDMAEKIVPLGSKLYIGKCILRVTPEPHNPCSKFRDRFGKPAFIACARNKTLNLRGIYLQVITGGFISIGDEITIVSA